MAGAAQSRSVNIYDVAERAGVSHQTVSRVINGLPNVRPATSEKVRTAMAELGYRPSAAARSLAERRSHTIGVLVVEGGRFGPDSYVHSIESAARARGYTTLATSLRGDDEPDVPGVLDHLLGRQLEGLIVVLPRDGQQQHLDLLPADLPVVSLEAEPPRAQAFVASDNAAGGALAADHLLQLGHRRLAHVSGPTDWPEARLRTAGWQEAVTAGGGEVVAVWEGDWDAGSGYAAGAQLAERDDVTGVFVANDQMALGLLTALHEVGRRVPDELSVVGYDNLPESAWYWPPLTTVEQRFEEVGRAALTQLLDAIDGERPAPVLITPRLVTRSSTRATG